MVVLLDLLDQATTTSVDTMWKRLPFQPKKEHAEIGAPTLIERTYNPQLFDESEALTALPTMDSRPSSKDGNPDRASHVPTVSSRYSEDSIFAAYEEDDSNSQTGRNTARDKSLSSSRVQSVSPIEITNQSDSTATPGRAGTKSPDGPSDQAKRSPFSSHIPTMRRTLSTKAKSPTGGPTVKSTRWDEYSGEPTAAPTGRQAQIRPSNYTDQFRSASGGSDYGNTCEISGPVKKLSIAERAAKFGRDTLTLDTRPPWKGVGGQGRTAIVPPVHDTSVPRVYTAVKNVSRARTASLETSDGEESTDSRRPRKSHPLSPISPVVEDAESPSISGTLGQPAQQMVSPMSVRTATEYFPSPVSPNITRQPSQGRASTKVIRKPVRSHVSDSENTAPEHAESVERGVQSHATQVAQQPSSHFSWTTFAESHADPAESIKTSYREDSNPGSRFNWSTVRTATTYQQDSPPPSPPPAPVPALSDRSFTSRRRPVPRQDKPPTPPPSGLDTSRFATPKQKAMSTSKTTPTQLPTPDTDKSKGVKALPPPPAASRTMTHVEELTSQRDDLELQRRNLQKAMKDFERIEIASPLVVDQKTRKENKQKLDQCQKRLEDIAIEEHDVGRALARARRKVEREEGIGSGLWVRRVTD